MESLIATVNKLQDICHVLSVPLPLDLPQIAVVGLQSSGKSSVIEAIVQREFLPRGTGIVTRRPLIIRLFKLSEKDSDQPDGASQMSDWAKFTHTERIFTDFDEVRQEIERETERVCGTNKGISSEPITLGVYSKNVVNLTLVDLPGLIKIPTGSQPEDIEIQIHQLVMNYIKNPNTIVLAVSEATADIVTSDAIRLAREVDPKGKRTLVVLTKLDMMFPGTDASEVLTGKILPMKLGIVGVVNRSQPDIIEKKPMHKALEDESKFFQAHYPKIAHQNGQPYLSKRLSHLLMNHIRDCLPHLKAKANSLISEYQAKLDSYGEPVKDKTQTILDIINKFSLSYCRAIEGGTRHAQRAELDGGARIQFIFRDKFAPVLSTINPLESLNNNVILTTALNIAGAKSDFNDSDVFESLITDEIKRLEDPCLQCADLVHKEMCRNFKYCSDEVNLDLMRFPRLGEKIEEVLTKLLDERLPVAKDAIINLIAYCSALIDTKHPKLKESSNVHYYEENKSVIPTGITGDDVNLKHERCERIARKVNAYFNFTRDDLKHYVPGVIMHCMVNHIKSNLNSSLMKEIYHHDLFDELLSESDDIAKRRIAAKEMLGALKQASKVINEIDDK